MIDPESKAPDDVPREDVPETEARTREREAEEEASKLGDFA